MTDRLFPAVLTFAVLIGSTLAVGSEIFTAQTDDRSGAVATLPRVVVTGSIRQDAVVAQRETKSYVQ